MIPRAGASDHYVVPGDWSRSRSNGVYDQPSRRPDPGYRRPLARDEYNTRYAPAHITPTGGYGRAPVNRPYQGGPFPQIQWRSDLRDAALEVQRVQRPMIIRVTADWCGYCTRMKRETYADAEVVRQISSGFVACNIDADQNPQLLKYAEIQTLPTTLVVSPQLRVVGRLEGFKTADELTPLLLRYSRSATIDEMDVKVAAR